MTVLERLGAWVATPHPLPNRLPLHVLDTVGALCAGTGTAEAALLRRLNSRRLLGIFVKASPRAARVAEKMLAAKAA